MKEANLKIVGLATNSEEAKQHSIPAEQKSGSRLRIETRNCETVLLCEGCDRPFLTIKDGEIRLLNKHGSVTHENVLTLEHLRTVIFEAYRQTHPPEIW